MPIAGYNVIGGTAGTNNANGMRVNKITLPVAGTISKISAYLDNQGASDQVVRAILYADNANSPSSFIAVSPEITIVSGAPGAWVDFSINRFLNAADYWIGSWTGPVDQNINYFFDNDAAFDRWINLGATYSSTDNPPDPFGGSFSNNAHMSMYAIYDIYTFKDIPQLGSAQMSGY